MIKRILFLLLPIFAFTCDEYLYGAPGHPRYIFGQTDDAEVFEMSDYTLVFKMGDHFYQVQKLIHVKDCPGCASLQKSSDKD